MSQLSNIKNVKGSWPVTTLFQKTRSKFYCQSVDLPTDCRTGRPPRPDTGVLEIGPGLGVLTWELAARARKVVAVELDERLLPVLGETLAGFDNVKVIQADVLKIDLDALLRQEFPNMEVVICANLPYYITSPIVMRLLETRLPVKAITVMVQKEAAARICAAPGSRNAGALSAAVSYYAVPQILFPVSRGSFMPAPEVDSAVIRLDIRPQPAVSPVDEALFFKVIRAGFPSGGKRCPILFLPDWALPRIRPRLRCSRWAFAHPLGRRN